MTTPASVGRVHIWNFRDTVHATPQMQCGFVTVERFTQFWREATCLRCLRKTYRLSRFMLKREQRELRRKAYPPPTRGGGR